MELSQLKLTKNALLAAQLVAEKHPYAVFTSGRRSVQGQARVMASNTCKYGVSWLLSTYKNRRMVKCLVAHVDENPERLRDPQQLAVDFYDLLRTHFSEYFKQMPHVVGRAFDIAWPRDGAGQIDRASGEAICNTILELPAELGLELLLRKEGSLDVIHAQFQSPFEEAVT